MTRIFAAATLLAIVACTAPQNQTTSASSSPPAASQASSASSGGMTEPQARMHAMSGGYSNLSTLTKGEDGTWRGSGVMGGQTVNFAVDPQGKISTQ